MAVPRTNALRYGLIAVTGQGIGLATVERMLDPEGAGAARALGPQEILPLGTVPVLVSDTTLYGATCVETLMRRWTAGLPRPWLVLVADAPARPVPDARYLVRALESRLAGVARVPYLPVLRAVRGADEALEHKTVRAAAQTLRDTMEGKW
ncbi:hypothetical protein AB0G74_32390 [Streptomyces sp. NPDC020875]|uniref:hypothetical protein n=1 Tax=Streptomyces sp. NPDC020875 TaxID=3154898 RepID=UPI0033C240DE